DRRYRDPLDRGPERRRADPRPDPRGRRKPPFRRSRPGDPRLGARPLYAAPGRHLYRGGQARHALVADMAGLWQPAPPGPVPARLRCYNAPMITEIGHFALVLALCVALLQAVLPLYGAARGDGPLIAWARPAALAQFLFVAIAFFALMHAYAVSDFSLANVA